MDFCDQYSLNITDQADIDNGPLRLVPEGQSTFICIRNATGTLKFSNLTLAGAVDVQQSPNLEILEFPDLYTLTWLQISQATSLTNISLPSLGFSMDCSEMEALNYLNITGAPSLKSFAVRNPSCLWSITLFDVREPLPGEPSNLPLENVSMIYNISTNNDLSLDDLRSASSLDFRDSAQFLPNLTFVENISLKNTILGLTLPIENDLPPDATALSISPLTIGDTMTVELSPHYGNLFGRVERIGGDLNISSNSGVSFDYRGLLEVGRGLSIWNNTNCTFGFDAVANLSTLLFADNDNIRLPPFISLERAENIYISGVIDTSTGPNIFPALVYVPGNVTVEALNDDFDCSKLVSQWKDQVIHNLRCVGRNNMTDTPTSTSGNGTSTPVPSTSDKSLSRGAQAGIGVGTGIVAIGILGAVIWLIIHFRNHLRTLESEKTKRSDDNGSSTEPEQPHILQTSEMGGRGIFREKPDDPLVEMPTHPVELPTRSYSWAGTEGEVGLAM